MIRNQKDFLAGLLFAIFGVVLCYWAPDYGIGTAAEMGSGAFPLVLGVALIVIGSLTTFRSLCGSLVSMERLALKPMVLVSAAVVFFGLAVESAGALIAIFLATLLTTLASDEFTVTSRIAISCVLTVFSILTFVWGLGVRVPLVGGFL